MKIQSDLSPNDHFHIFFTNTSHLKCLKSNFEYKYSSLTINMDVRTDASHAVIYTNLKLTGVANFKHDQNNNFNM